MTTYATLVVTSLINLYHLLHQIKILNALNVARKTQKNSYVLQIFLIELAKRKVKTPAIHPLDFPEHNF